MTKPHEEEWSTGEGALSGALYTKDGTWIGAFTTAGRARLAVQAPKLALALRIMLTNDGHAPHCQGGNPPPWLGNCSAECKAARSALIAAGVPLP